MPVCGRRARGYDRFMAAHQGHDHAAADRRSLAIALVLILCLLGAEIVVGIVASSLALLADAGHLVTDAAALALALVAAAVAQRPPGGSWTFGFRRVEILAALANGITLLLIGIWIVYAAVRRLVSPPEVRGGLVVGIAGAGIVVNLAVAALLARPSRRSLNVRGAFLHVATDLAAFVGTAIAGALILFTGWDRFDPLASLAVAALIFWSSGILLRESSRILLEVSPGGTAPLDVEQAMLAMPGVVEVHDLHVWTVGSGFPVLSAHVLVASEADCHEARRELAAMLGERFDLEHTTLQVEHARPRRRLRLELPLARR
jgi:cobalt-zinc-cadmium efflux system protein